MKNSKLIVTLCIIVVLSIGSYGIYKLIYSDKPKQLLLQFGESFPNIKMMDNKGYEIKGSEILTDKTTLIFYGSKDCSWCINELKLMKYCNENMEINKKFNIVYLWSDEIPKKNLDTEGIPYEMNYSLNNNYMLSDVTPTVFMVKEGKIIFLTNETDKLLNKIIDSVNIQELQESAVQSIGKLANNKSENVLFLSEDCEECQQIKHQLDMDQYTIISDYDMENTIIDKFMFFKKILGVDLYPSLLTNEDGTYTILSGYDDIKDYEKNIVGSN